MSAEATANNTPAGRQFSLRSLMIAITALCFLCALIAVPPLFVICLGLVYVTLTGAIALTIWKGRGWIQAFAVGAVFPHLGGFLMALNSSSPFELVTICLFFELVAGLAGIGSAAYHGFLVRRKGSLPVPDLPFIRSWFANDPIE